MAREKCSLECRCGYVGRESRSGIRARWLEGLTAEALVFLWVNLLAPIVKA